MSLKFYCNLCSMRTGVLSPLICCNLALVAFYIVLKYFRLYHTSSLGVMRAGITSWQLIQWWVVNLQPKLQLVSSFSSVSPSLCETVHLAPHRQVNVHITFKVGLAIPLNIHRAHSLNIWINAGSCDTQALLCCITGDIQEGITSALPLYYHSGRGKGSRQHGKQKAPGLGDQLVWVQAPTLFNIMKKEEGRSK